MQYKALQLLIIVNILYITFRFSMSKEVIEQVEENPVETIKNGEPNQRNYMHGFCVGCHRLCWR
jgi:hypothetical protein